MQQKWTNWRIMFSDIVSGSFNLPKCFQASLLFSQHSSSSQRLCSPVGYRPQSQRFQEGCQGSVGLGISRPSRNSQFLFGFMLNKNCSTCIWIKTRGLIFVICTASIGKLICAKHISSFNLKHRALPLWFQGNWELGQNSSLLALSRAVLEGSRNSFRRA